MQPESQRTNVSEEVLDSVYANLADRRRRCVVACLSDAQTPVTREVLLRRVVERETGSSPDSVPDERIDRIYLSVYHVHLPKLEDAGIVTADDESKTVERGPRFETALELLPE